MNIEEEAREIVEGARRQNYGHPRENHCRTAHLWQVYIYTKYGNGFRPFDLTEEDVCYMNILQKMSRDMHAASKDNLVDMIGFILNVDTLRNDTDSA